MKSNMVNEMYYQNFINSLLTDKNRDLQKEKFDALYRVNYAFQNHNVHWVYFDIETTSRDNNLRNGVVIEIAAYCDEHNQFKEIANPGFPITNSYIHGITDDMVRYANSTQVVLNNFFIFINNIKKTPDDIVILIGHNAASFDKKIIENHLNDFKFNREFYYNIFIADTLHSFKRFISLKSYSLENIYKEIFDESYIESHRALDDCKDLKRIVDYFTNKHQLSIFDILEKYIYQLNFKSFF